ncbi:MAG: hypothetical protein LBP59_10480 [Planctomycetaceae bacterium]|jgi:hypothetical protein|nr:hypothetical protein [Planctomycetaceae bacterium]
MTVSLFIEHNPAIPYGAGAKVTSGKYLYQAIRDVPPNILVTDTEYWVTQGDGGGNGEIDVVALTNDEVDLITNLIFNSV